MLNLARWNPLKELERWDPVRELEGMEGRFTRWFGRLPVHRERNHETLAMAEWMPLVDISEDDREYLITAELPEVKKEEIRVHVENGELTIQGERKLEREEKGKKYHRIERGYGSFTRSFALPDDADPTKVSAEFRDGTLKVHLPKSATTKSKAIDVKVT